LPSWLQPDVFTKPWEEVTKGMSEFQLMVTLLLSSLKGVLLLLALIAVSIVLFEGIARLIGRPLSRLIDRLVWTSVRQQAWGDDKDSEDVNAIAAHPPLFRRRFAPLPDVVSRELSAFSDKHAIATLQRVRELLGMATAPQPSADVRAELAKTLSWRELIHTSYFDIPACARIIAFGLNRAQLGQLGAEHWPDAIKAEVEGWYQAIHTAKTQTA
jgi:hypothetical protein